MSMKLSPSRRRWTRFSLLTLIIVVNVAGVVLWRLTRVPPYLKKITVRVKADGTTEIRGSKASTTGGDSHCRTTKRQCQRLSILRSG